MNKTAVFLLLEGAQVQRVHAGCVQIALLLAERMSSMILGSVQAYYFLMRADEG